MHDFREQCQTLFHAMLCLSTMFHETIIRLGFCDIQKNQGLGKRYQTRPLACVQTSLSLQIKSGRGDGGVRLYTGYGLSARLLTLTSTLIILDITKPSSSNCLLSFSRTKPKYFSSYNHGLKSWDTFVFLRRFPIHIGPTPPLTPQTMLDACIQNFFPEFQLCIGWGEGELQENFENGSLF